jgi:hypothetical protein
LIKPKNSVEKRAFGKLYPGLDSWKELNSYVKKIPSNYGKHINAKKGVGVKWQIDQGGKKYELRIDKAQPNSPFKSQQSDHVSITVGTKVVDNTGKNYIMENSKEGILYKIKRSDWDAGRKGVEYRFDINKNPETFKPGYHPDAHIPVNEWIKWKDILKPKE